MERYVSNAIAAEDLGRKLRKSKSKAGQKKEQGVYSSLLTWSLIKNGLILCIKCHRKRHKKLVI